MAERAKSIVDVMKEKINKSSSGLQNLFYVRKDGKVRIRFLSDIDDGLELRFHSKWQKYNHLCLSYLGKDCPHCDEEEEGGTKYDMYAFTIWNYESKKREVFMYKATKNSPIFQLISMYEEFGTIMDRDFVIQKRGEGVNTLYTVVPLEKKAFKGDEVAFTKKKLIRLVSEAMPYEGDSDDDEDDEDSTPPWNEKKKVNTKKSSRKVEEDDDEDEDEEDEAPAKNKSRRKSSRSSKVDDDDDEEPDDDDEDDSDDEEEDEPPIKKRASSTKRNRR